LDDYDIQITSQINPDAVPQHRAKKNISAFCLRTFAGLLHLPKRCPAYDVIHALNRYYQEMDTAIASFGGQYR